MARILIVDDERSLRRTLGVFLRQAGYEAVEAEDATAALAHLRQGGVDVMLTDIILPRVDGVELLRAAAALAPGVPVIMMTGEPTPETAAESVRAGAFDYLAKPVDKDAILRAVANAARVKALADEKRRLEAENRRYQEQLERRVEERTRELREREARLCERTRLLDLATNLITVRRLDGTLTYWNGRAERLFGLAARAAAGPCRLHEVLGCAEAQLAGPEAEVLAKGEWSGEVSVRAADGVGLTLLLRWTLIRDEQGQPDAVLCIGTDVTEHRALETQFLRAQRLESIGQLASGIAHDLNNLLAPILMSAPLLRYDLAAAEKEEMLAGIEQSATQAAALIRQLLAFGRGHEGERVRVQMRHLIRDLVGVLRSTLPRSIQIVDRLPRDLWLVQADPGQMHQVLMNLCVNARDAMPRGGRLSLRVENLIVDEQFAALQGEATPGPHLRCTVEDTGVGIPAEVLARLFEPFFTTKAPGKGTGLGLATARRIVASHGGFLRVRTEVGAGSSFEVYLPAQPGAVEGAAETVVLGARRPGAGIEVLVVDDELTVRRTLQRTLERHGYRVQSAGDAMEALLLFAKDKDRIRVLITDYMMPLMDGVMLSKAVRRLQPTLPIILATGLSAEGEDARQTQDWQTAGFNVVLTKPFSAAALLDAVESVVPQRPDSG